MVELEALTYGVEQAEGNFMGVFPGAGCLLFTGVFDGHQSFRTRASFKSDHPARIHSF